MHVHSFAQNVIPLQLVIPLQTIAVLSMHACTHIIITSVQDFKRVWLIDAATTPPHLLLVH